MTLDQLDFCTTSIPHGSVHTIPSVDNSVESIGAGMFKESSLLGTFSIPPPICYISSTSLDLVSCDQASTSSGPGISSSSLLSVPSLALGVSDPWVLLDPSSIDFLAESIPLTAVELEYQAIQMASEDATLPRPSEGPYDPYTSPYWTATPPSSGDVLNSVLPSDEAILEAMVGSDCPWDEMHHRSSFLPHQFEVTSVSNVGLMNGSHVLPTPMPLLRKGIWPLSQKPILLIYRPRWA